MLITLIATPGRRRWLLGGVVVLLLFLAAFLIDGDLGSIYGNRDEAIKAQKTHNYVLVGTLGRPEWPAIVVGRETGEGGVRFVTADGQPHQYQGFSGPMKALEFRAGLTGAKRFTLVFHQVKARVDNSPFKDIR